MELRGVHQERATTRGGNEVLTDLRFHQRGPFSVNYQRGDILMEDDHHASGWVQFHIADAVSRYHR